MRLQLSSIPHQSSGLRGLSSDEQSLNPYLPKDDRTARGTLCSLVFGNKNSDFDDIESDICNLDSE
jgi:hypothetical protein